jgi:serine/threonine-protein kinase RsbW
MTTYPAIFASLARICSQVRQAASVAGFEKNEVYEIELAVDEACSNIIEHSYGAEGLGDIRCDCIETTDSFSIILQDTGCCFDPGDVPEPDLVSPVGKRREGGLGIFFMRQGMDEVHFEPCEGTGTRLTMVRYKKRKIH